MRPEMSATSFALRKGAADDERADPGRQELCRRLARIRVSRIMSHSPVVVPRSFSVAETGLLLRRHRVRAAAVVDETGRVLGIVTLAEIDRLIADLSGSDRSTANRS